MSPRVLVIRLRPEIICISLSFKSLILVSACPYDLPWPGSI
jgi:hypothetical protein